MKKYTLLVIGVFAILSIAQGAVEEPCEDGSATCLSGFFEKDPLSGPADAVTADGSAADELSASQRTSSKDSRTVKNVVIEYLYHNTTLKRPEMKITGLSKAKVYKFLIDSEKKKALLTVHFPAVTVSGSKQSYNFHNSGQPDVVLDKDLKYSTLLEEVYTTTIYDMNGNLVDYNSGKTNSQLSAQLPEYSTRELLSPYAKQSSLVQAFIDVAYQHPKRYAREYIKPIGEHLYKAYLASLGF